MALVIDSSIGTGIFENFSLVTSSIKDVSSNLINEEIEKTALVKKDGTKGTTTTTMVQLKDRGSVLSYQSEIILSKVEEGLYLGSVLASRNMGGLKELNITHVLIVSNILSPLYPNDFTYKTIKVVDTPGTNIAQHFGECFNFIEEAKSMGGGVLVHCDMAISRSPTIVIAYLMKKHATSLKEALREVQTTRSIVQPNCGFILQLKNLEQSLKGFSSMNCDDQMYHQPTIEEKLENTEFEGYGDDPVHCMKILKSKCYAFGELKVYVVKWLPPSNPWWVKINTDGLSKGNPGPAACGGVFRDCNSSFLGGFCVSLGELTAFCAELSGLIVAVECAYQMGLTHIWLELDCLSVVECLKHEWFDPPTELKIRWDNCKRILSQMKYKCTHIYREGNRVADAITKLGLNYNHLKWWDSYPDEIEKLLQQDASGVRQYRIK